MRNTIRKMLCELLARTRFNSTRRFDSFTSRWRQTMHSTLGFKGYYRRLLPHFQNGGACYFVTFRLYGSLPQKAVDFCRNEVDLLRRQASAATGSQRIELEKECSRLTFKLYEKHLDSSTNEPRWLQDERVAECVFKGLKFGDGKSYRLDAFCIMSNHVHVVLEPLRNSQGGFISLSKILHSLKGFTAHQSNKILGRRGRFWENESFDHLIRNEDGWQKIVSYILNNPVKAKLTDDWRKWRWSYFRLGKIES
jgi:putative transposase